MSHYQSKRRCAKTLRRHHHRGPLSHYQSKRRCAKTNVSPNPNMSRSHYQSKRRCAKTQQGEPAVRGGLITSQNDAAPKQRLLDAYEATCLITSQNDAAPKHARGPSDRNLVSLPVKTTLRQNARRRCLRTGTVSLPVKTTLRQNPWTSCAFGQRSHYQSKRRCAKTRARAFGTPTSLITSQNDAAPKQMSIMDVDLQVSLPVKTTLRQNAKRNDMPLMSVSLPVKTTLRQNCRHKRP